MCGRLGRPYRNFRRQEMTGKLARAARALLRCVGDGLKTCFLNFGPARHGRDPNGLGLTLTGREAGILRDHQSSTVWSQFVDKSPLGNLDVSPGTCLPTLIPEAAACNSSRGPLAALRSTK